MSTRDCSRWRVEISSVLLAILVLGVGCAGTIQSDPTEILITGSDTMLVLNRRLAETYMRVTPGVAVVVHGGGSGVGVERLIGGETDICASSRPLQSEEVQRLHDRRGTLGVRFVVAQDALSIYLNPENPIRDLTLDQLEGIFSGRLETWDAIGGLAENISVIVRPPSSGTTRFFRDHVLRGTAYVESARTEARTVDVVAAVARDRSAVGYGGVAYGPGLVHSAIEGVRPEPAMVRDGSYSLTRYLHYYTAEPPRGELQAFIDWCLSEAGQRVVSEIGFVALWQE